MTATDRYDAQSGLLAPGALPTHDEYAALLHLLEVAERNVSRGLGDGPLRGAVIEAKEAGR